MNPPTHSWQKALLRFVEERCLGEEGEKLNATQYWRYYLEDEDLRKEHANYYQDHSFRPMSLSQFIAHELGLGMLLRKPKPAV